MSRPTQGQRRGEATHTGPDHHHLGWLHSRSARSSIFDPGRTDGTEPTGSARGATTDRSRPRGAGVPRGADCVIGQPAVTEIPRTATVVVIGAGIVGNCLVGHLSPLGVDRHGAARQRTAPESRRLDGPRIELHLPDRPQQGDGHPHAGQPGPVRSHGRQHHLRRYRGRAQSRATRGVQAAHDLGESLGHRR